MKRNENQYRRGEIWWVQLDPSIGYEAKKRCDPQLLSEAKSLRDDGTACRSAQDARERAPRQTRPCLILQNDSGNKYSRLTTIAPLLATKNYPFVVNIKPTEKNGLDRERGLHLSQIRAVDSSRVKSKLGQIEPIYWEQIYTAINIHLGFID